MINSRAKNAEELGFSNYLVFDTGRIENITTKKELKQSSDKDGYKLLGLSCNGKQKSFRVHRLVALLFLPNPEEKPAVNHIDGDKTNNHVDNLEWVTNKENTHHAFQTDLIKQSMIGEDVAHMVCRYLEKEKGITEISNLLNITVDAVKHIKYGGTYTSVSSKYNIPKSRTRSKNLTVNDIHRICYVMSEGHKNSKVCEICDITPAVVEGIRSKSYYTEISDSYIFPPPKKSASMLSERVIKLICSEISKKKNPLDIANKVGCKIGNIYAIKRRQTYTDISKNYEW